MLLVLWVGMNAVTLNIYSLLCYIVFAEEKYFLKKNYLFFCRRVPRPRTFLLFIVDYVAMCGLVFLQ